MNLSNRGLKLAAGFLSVALAASILSGCSQTSEAQPNIVERAQGETAPPPPPSNGFLGADYALLKPKSQDPNAPSIIGDRNSRRL